MDEVDRLIAEHGEQVVMAAVEPLLSEERRRRIDAVLDARLASLTIVLENLYDPHNGAAAVRSVEAFGLGQLHVIDGPTGTFRASGEVTIGCDKWIDIHQHPDVDSCARALRDSGWQLAATVPGAPRRLADLDMTRPMALWFGNEREGLSRAARSVCDVEVGIPMWGFTRSLNLSVSVALLISEAAARRRAVLGRSGDLDDRVRRRLRARWSAVGVRGLAAIVDRHVSGGTRTTRVAGDTDGGSKE